MTIEELIEQHAYYRHKRGDTNNMYSHPSKQELMFDAQTELWLELLHNQITDLARECEWEVKDETREQFIQCVLEDLQELEAQKDWERRHKNG